jgi:hypothetical protein
MGRMQCEMCLKMFSASKMRLFAGSLVVHCSAGLDETKHYTCKACGTAESKVSFAQRRDYFRGLQHYSASVHATK